MTMRAMRVLCISDGDDRPTIASFIAMRQFGVDLKVACPEDDKNKELLRAAAVPTLDFCPRNNFDNDAIRCLRQELVNHKIQIVHTFNNRAVTNALRAVKGLPVKVVTYRGVVGAVGFLDPMSWMRYLNPRIDRVVCVSEAIRRHFLSMQPAFLRMPKFRPVTIHKGHKLEWYSDEPAELGTLGIPPGAFVVNCTANYRPRKGIEVLVEAIERLPSEIPCHLLLVGHMNTKRLDRRIARSSARERIHRVGYRNDAPTITAASDVFCLPSTKREGLARAIIEAMAYRVPAIVTDSGGSPELVINEQCGLVVPIHDAEAITTAILRLYKDPELRTKLGQAARRRLGREFTHEKTVSLTIALYEDLLATSDE